MLLSVYCRLYSLMPRNYVYVHVHVMIVCLHIHTYTHSLSAVLSVLSTLHSLTQTSPTGPIELSQQARMVAMVMVSICTYVRTCYFLITICMIECQSAFVYRYILYVHYSWVVCTCIASSFDSLLPLPFPSLPSLPSLPPSPPLQHHTPGVSPASLLQSVYPSEALGTSDVLKEAMQVRMYTCMYVRACM